ncbi:hypothetical protein ACFSHQ_04470 [Gemmobacter lanyuensis]
MQAHRELRDGLGLTRLSITDIFRFPVLSALAAHLGDAPRPAPAPPLPRARRWWWRRSHRRRSPRRMTGPMRGPRRWPAVGR